MTAQQLIVLCGAHYVGRWGQETSTDPELLDTHYRDLTKRFSNAYFKYGNCLDKSQRAKLGVTTALHFVTCPLYIHWHASCSAQDVQQQSNLLMYCHERPYILIHVMHHAEISCRANSHRIRSFYKIQSSNS